MPGFNANTSCGPALNACRRNGVAYVLERSLAVESGDAFLFRAYACDAATAWERRLVEARVRPLLSSDHFDLLLSNATKVVERFSLVAQSGQLKMKDEVIKKTAEYTKVRNILSINAHTQFLLLPPLRAAKLWYLGRVVIRHALL